MYAPISTEKKEQNSSGKDLALLVEILYTIFVIRVARAMVVVREVRFLYELCCSGEK